MRVVIRRLEQQGGQKVAVERTLDADRVTLGRGTDQHVYLPDLRLPLAYAEIRIQPSGPYRIDARTRASVWVNGVPGSGQTLTIGDVVDCGRFRVTVARPELGVDLLLEVEERVSAREEKSRRKEQFLLRLDQTSLRKRRMAWVLFLAVLIPTLLLPVLARYWPGRQSTLLMLDRVWDTGRLSAAHSFFGQDCGRCHERPFRNVRNEACLECHTSRPHHTDQAGLLALPGLADARCGDCHQEHGGLQALIVRHPSLCADCHAKPDARYAAAHLAPAEDFARRHPDFALRLSRYDPRTGFSDTKVVQSAPEAPLWEQSNLKFTHDRHLDPRGINAPKGKRVMICADCHVPEGDGASFKPIGMQAHCDECHRLDFDPKDPKRVVPHSQPAQVAAVIRDYYAHRALAGEIEDAKAPPEVRLRRRPGEPLKPKQQEAILRWAQARAEVAMRDVFSRRLCNQCHVVTATGESELPWRIAPVALTRQYFAAARFDHAAHATEPCSNCHAAEKSKDSRDVLIPDIRNCRECHGGTDSTGRVPSACVDCHDFHIARSATFDGSSTAKSAKP